MRMKSLAALGAAALFSLTGALAQAGETIRFAVTDLAGLEQLQREFSAFKDVLEERSADPVRNIIHELVFSPDGTAMATVGGDRLVRVWDVAGREELGRFTGHGAFTRGVGFSPDGTTLYTCSDDGTVRAWPASG
jgi:WD40 repeat protein